MNIIIIITIGILTVYAAWKGVAIKEKVEALQDVPDSVSKWWPVVQAAAQKYKVPAKTLMGMLWVESAGDPNAVGSSDEIGLMQLKEIAVQDLRLHNRGEFEQWRTNPVVNIEAGAAFLRLQFDRGNDGNWANAVRAYNQGFEGAKRRPDLATAYLRKVEEKSMFFA